MKLAKKLLVIGWDAADWKIIHPLMDAGHMPTLEKMINNGVMGNIATLDPPFSIVNLNLTGLAKALDLQIILLGWMGEGVIL